MASSDAGNTCSSKVGRLVHPKLFVVENDDESRLEARVAKLVSSMLSPSMLITNDPVYDTGIVCFVLHAGSDEVKTPICPEIVIARSNDASIQAANLAAAAAAALGIGHEHSAKLCVSLGCSSGPLLTPTVKKLAREYDDLVTAHNDYRAEQDAFWMLRSAIAERHEAWSSVLNQSSGLNWPSELNRKANVVDVFVTLSYYWFTVTWTGSNKVVAPHVFVAKDTHNEMSKDLQQQVASLAEIADCATIKITLESPTGPELTMPLYRFLNRTCIGRESIKLEQAWNSLRQHPHNLLLQTPAKPIQLFLSAHSPAALAVDGLCVGANSVNEAYMKLDTKLRGHPQVALAAVCLDWSCLCLPNLVPRHLLSNKKFVLDALAVCRVVGKCGLVFSCADEKLKDDADVVLAAVTCDGMLLEHMSQTMRASKSVVLAAISNDPSALKYASAALQSDPDVVAACNKVDP